MRIPSSHMSVNGIAVMEREGHTPVPSSLERPQGSFDNQPPIAGTLGQITQRAPVTGPNVVASLDIEPLMRIGNSIAFGWNG